jgi:hypothetical protein
MSDAPRIVRRRCPDCGGALIASRGVAWMPCSACAMAVNLFAAPADRIRCRRIRAEGEVILPFYRFGESWVPAFRSAGSEAWAMAHALEAIAASLQFADAPCGVALGRDVEEARALLAAAGDAVAELIAVPCRVHGDVVTEPATRTTLRRTR